MAEAAILPFDPPAPRRAATRDRIVTAARHIFFEKGYAGATMEEVARAAGLQRATLYLHFREKAELLNAIAADYSRKLEPVVAMLPGPVPDAAQLRAWVDRMADFVMSEREATDVIVSMSHLADAPPAAHSFGAALWSMLAARVDAFARARAAGESVELAWGTAVLEELGWALCKLARSGDGAYARNRLAVATVLLSRFIAGTLAEEDA